MDSSLAASPGAFDVTSESSNAAAGSDVSAAASGDAFVNEHPAPVGASTTARGSNSITAAAKRLSIRRVGSEERGVTGAAAVMRFAVAAEPGDEKEDAAADGSGLEEAATGGAVDTSAADDVADAIARATAGFALPAPSKAQAGGEIEDGFTKPRPRLTSGGRGDAAAGTDGGDMKALGRSRIGGVSSSLMRGTASSTSRLKLSVPSALEESRSGSAPRSASRRPSTGECRLIALL